MLSIACCFVRNGGNFSCRDSRVKDFSEAGEDSYALLCLLFALLKNFLLFAFDFGNVASISDEAARNGKHKPRPPYDPLAAQVSRTSLRGRPKNIVKMSPCDPPLGAPRPINRLGSPRVHTHAFSEEAD